MPSKAPSGWISNISVVSHRMHELGGATVEAIRSIMNIGTWGHNPLTD
jgi:hypothetical protein